MPNSSSASNIEVDINQIATDLNGKADKDLSNTSPVSSFSTLLDNADIRTVVETYHSGTEWYRIWSDGWCEQGGFIQSVTQNSLTSAVITFLKPFVDSNYYISLIEIKNNSSDNSSATNCNAIYTRTNTSATIATYSWTNGRIWEAKGYIS